ncbi:hypothetical protein MRX96_053036 [Rhipicephalus microplus]
MRTTTPVPCSLRPRRRVRCVTHALPKSCRDLRSGRWPRTRSAEQQDAEEAVTGLHQSSGHRFVVPVCDSSACGASTGRLSGRPQSDARGSPRPPRGGDFRFGRRHTSSGPGSCARGT